MALGFTAGHLMEGVDTGNDLMPTEMILGIHRYKNRNLRGLEKKGASPGYVPLLGYLARVD